MAKCLPNCVKLEDPEEVGRLLDLMKKVEESDSVQCGVVARRSWSD